MKPALRYEVVTFRVERELIEAMRRMKERDGVSLIEQLRRALRAWLEGKGIEIEAPAGKAARRRR